MTKEDAVNHFGGPAKLAKVLGIASQAVSQWGEFVPEGRAYQLQHITKGKLKVEAKPMKQVS